MRASKLITLACACALGSGGTAPLAARAHADSAPALDARPVFVAPRADRKADDALTGGGDSAGGDSAAARVAPAGASSSVVDTTAASQQSQSSQQARPRKKENAFVRILAAPFRGLARLFGDGGGERTRAARVKIVETPRRESAASAPASPQRADAPTADLKSAQQLATVLPQPIPAPTPLLMTRTPGALPATTAADSRPAARAAASGEDAYEPAPFIPLVVGVPGDPLSQGRALLEHGYTTEAIAELSVAAVNSQNLVEANNLLGLAYDRRGWHAQAREAFERALSAAPADPHVLNNLGYSLYLGDHYKDALGRLKQAARLAPANPHILNNLALVYGRLGKYDDAFKHFERAGGELYARMQTGSLLEAAGRDRDAIKHFEAARRLDTASAEPLRRLIPLYNRTGQREKAEDARRELNRPATKSAASTSG
jgi:Flp pilus assembly protein TadD